MGRVIRWVVLVLVAGFFVALLTFNTFKKPDNSGLIWDKGATVGELDAPHYYVMYTDLACPYCDAFSRLVHDNYDDFKQFIAEHKILFEVRLTDFLYEYGEHKPDMSRWSAEAAYCAAEEGKFWDYYYAAIGALWNDYHSKGIGVSKTAPKIEGMTEDYWLDIGKDIGLSDEFVSCYTEHKSLDKVKENTAKAVKQVQNGLPYFKFGKFATGGFDQSWGYDKVKELMEAGL
ncbi:thioredoxin domain-containing protein [Candidatus Saccharibacteria bacterium]|nr:thioredoxin domain-containing protein [Candidatus Saccharibacteria bacterium]